MRLHFFNSAVTANSKMDYSLFDWKGVVGHFLTNGRYPNYGFYNYFTTKLNLALAVQTLILSPHHHSMILSPQIAL